ncbi:Ase inhibitor propeptide protein [Trichophyton interdigitale]|uniref:Ase inhibitor propeptide protein n=1 Tax=Trichophyton interdigitale TaxID=101480 RepID=A0A9P5CWP3_9EURO|nr:Peptidase S8 proteinase inhibitor [Trichophyton interdigitale]KAF3895561.1 Peptidase S8 proteinase inhibitor [Trichophyton interdigitale]KAG8210770.1 Ase inhibitor propeptide protein [Trichophyton interdigitale]
MKVSLALVLAALTPAIMAANMKSVIVSFGSDAPDSVVQKAKDAITEAGGKINHEYCKGFSGEMPESMMDQVKTLDAQYPATIEEDQVVSVNA